jgi:hypothetical protein
MMEMMTTEYKGRHIIVFSQFPRPGTKPPKPPKPKKGDLPEQEQLQETIPAQQPEMEAVGGSRTSAWLSAVLIKQRNPSGIFRFSPDASFEETQRIVRGLKNVINYSNSLGSKGI